MGFCFACFLFFSLVCQSAVFVFGVCVVVFWFCFFVLLGVLFCVFESVFFLGGSFIKFLSAFAFVPSF